MGRPSFERASVPTRVSQFSDGLAKLQCGLNLSEKCSVKSLTFIGFMMPLFESALVDIARRNSSVGFWQQSFAERHDTNELRFEITNSCIYLRFYSSDELFS